MKKEELDFPTTKEYTKKDVQRVQKRLLEMADQVTSILDKHHIDYMIGFGTLLGAVRHQGFIPWDDDFDIFLFNNQYEDALQALRKELPKDMIVHDKLTDPIYWPYWSRVRDINSDFYSQLDPYDNNYKYRGINLDLYRMDLIKQKDATKLKFENYLSYHNRIFQSGLIDEEKYQKAKSELFPQYQKACREAEKSHDENEVYWFILGYEKGLAKDAIFPLKKYKYEGHIYLGPNNADVLLSTKYGDYHTIPNYSKRKTHYTWVRFNQPKDKKS